MRGHPSSRLRGSRFTQTRTRAARLWKTARNGCRRDRDATCASFAALHESALGRKRPSGPPPEGPLTEVLRTSFAYGEFVSPRHSYLPHRCTRASGLRFSRAARRTVSLHRSGTCGRRQRQISKARQTSIGSAFVSRPRYLAVLSICAWPKSARTVCKSPVPFKMWRAFVRRKDSTP
jgi:hypothetical protein